VPSDAHGTAGARRGEAPTVPTLPHGVFRAGTSVLRRAAGEVKIASAQVGGVRIPPGTLLLGFLYGVCWAPPLLIPWALQYDGRKGAAHGRRDTPDIAAIPVTLVSDRRRPARRCASSWLRRGATSPEFGCTG